jgi:hypothetical protein
MADKLLRRKISLKEKPHKTETVERSHYPSLYLYDLPLKDADVGEKFSAEVSLKLTSITKRTGQRSSFDFEVINIKFK